MQKLIKFCAMPFFPTDIHNKSISPLERDDQNTPTLDLNRKLVANPPSTFFAQVSESPGDILIIDKSTEPHDGATVVIFSEGEFILKRIEIEEQQLWIASAESVRERQIDGDEIWGVVKYYIKKM